MRGEVRSGAAVDADPERHVAIRVAVDHEACRRRGTPPPSRPAATSLSSTSSPSLHGDAAELGVDRDDALVGAGRRIEAQELLGGEREQLGLVDQPLPVRGELRQVQQRAAGERRRRVDAADRREERDRLRDVLGKPLAVDLVVRDRGERVVTRRRDAVAELLVDAGQHRAVGLRGLLVLGRAGGVRGDAVEGVGEPSATRPAGSRATRG